MIPIRILADIETAVDDGHDTTLRCVTEHGDEVVLVIPSNLAPGYPPGATVSIDVAVID